MYLICCNNCNKNIYFMDEGKDLDCPYCGWSLEYEINLEKSRKLQDAIKEELAMVDKYNLKRI